MKFNQWTLALAGAGIVSLGSVAQAEEQHNVTTAVSSTTLSGYVDTSAIWKVGTGRGPLPGRTFDGADKVDGFNLNAIKVSLEKALGDEGTWSGGYKADLIFGPDANYYTTIVNGGGAPAADDFAVKQAYVSLRAPVGNGIDFKMGVWDTIIGYEFFESGSNPNYSRSYGYMIEPTHHTGLLASYKINDMVSLTGGIANAYAGGVNDKVLGAGAESKKTYLASITFTLPEGAGALKNSVISLGYVGGRNGTTTGTTGPIHRHTHSYYAGFTLNTPVEGLQVGAAWDYRDQLAIVGSDSSNDAYALAAYLSYGMDKWKLNLRADYIQATGGTIYAGSGIVGVAKTDRDELGSLTATLDYNLWENVLTRLETRWDRALSGDKPFAAADENAFTVALNAIYKF